MNTRLSILAIVLAISIAGRGADSTSPEVTPALTVTPAAGTVLTDFTFDASSSSYGKRALEFRWDWENDGTWDTEWSSESTVTRRFASGDTMEIKVEVREGSKTASGVASLVLDDRHGYILERFDLPSWGLPKDIAYDGASFWITNWHHSTIEIDPATGDSLGTISKPGGYTGGIAWDGEYLWVCDSYMGGAKIIKQDPSSGNILDYFSVVYTAQCGGLDWDGEAFYYGSDQSSSGLDGDGLIHKYLPDGTELLSFASPGGSMSPQGMCYDGQDLWVTIVERDTLYVVDADDGSVLRTVPHSEVGYNGVGRGVLVVDGYLWAILGGPGAPELAQMVP